MKEEQNLNILVKVAPNYHVPFLRYWQLKFPHFLPQWTWSKQMWCHGCTMASHTLTYLFCTQWSMIPKFPATAGLATFLGKWSWRSKMRLKKTESKRPGREVTEIGLKWDDFYGRNFWKLVKQNNLSSRCKLSEHEWCILETMGWEG